MPGAQDGEAVAVVDIKITGLDDVMNELERLSKDSSATEMAARMRAVQCPDHHLAPTNVRVVGTEVHAEFCCEKLRKLAADAALGPIVQGLH